MSEPLVTVGLPFFDEEQYLASAIRSILRQSFDDFELILLDDGSTDASLEIARSFADPRIVVLSHGVRRGLPARLNEIARYARGAFIARMDADDVAHPSRLERELGLFRRDPSYDAVGTWAALVNEEEELLAVCESSRLPATPRVALETGILAHATMLARAPWVKANPYDETLTRAEDRDLWCRTVDSAHFGVVPEPLYVIRVTTRNARFLSSYLESQRQNRQIFARYGPSTVGLARSARLRAASLGKCAVMSVASLLGAAPMLVRRRGRRPTARERTLVVEALAAVSARNG